MLVLAVGMMGPARAQNGVPADGSEILRGLIKYHGFTPVERLDRNSQSTLVMIVGRDAVPPEVVRRLPQHLVDGGGLLIVADGPFNLRPLLPQIGNLNSNLRISGLKVAHDLAAQCFRGEGPSPLPVVAPGDPTMLALAKRGAPVVLATRSPSTITALRNPLLSIELLHHAEGSRYAGVDGIAVQPETPLGVMSDPALPGTALAFANRTLFTNESMVATDGNGTRTDNFLYTFLIVRMLAERLKQNGGPRECLFIEDGRIQTDFDRVGFVEQPGMNLPPRLPPVLPPLPVLLDFAFDKGNDLLAQAEARDLPNAIQANDEDNKIRNGFLSVLAVVGAIVLTRYLLARGWSTRHAPELAPRHRIVPDRGGFIPERRYALLESGNLYEPMRDHLRHTFAQWGAPAGIADGLPALMADRPTRPIKRIATDLFRLWKLAYAPERAAVSPDNLEELEDMISELAQAHAAGIWRFADGGTA